MGIYQFLFFDPKGDFPALDVVECPDDGAAARTAAEQLVLHLSCRGVDVFLEDRLVMRLERPSRDIRPTEGSIHGLH